jgi:hypothetical protein
MRYNMKNLIVIEEKNHIDLICKDYNIKHYTINSDGSIDVHGAVNFHDKNLSKIPLRFGNVSGSFSRSKNHLTSLEGSPVTVGGTFSCYDNRLTSLVGGPKTVGNDYYCFKNQLTSLEGCPATVGGNFMCSCNNLTSTYSGDVDMEVIGMVDLASKQLPQLLQDNLKHIKTILRYQRHFFIWNDDLTLNEENFHVLLDEIEDGLE